MNGPLAVEANPFIELGVTEKLISHTFRGVSEAFSGRSENSNVEETNEQTEKLKVFSHEPNVKDWVSPFDPVITRLAPSHPSPNSSFSVIFRQDEEQLPGRRVGPTVGGLIGFKVGFVVGYPEGRQVVGLVVGMAVGG